MKFLFPIILAIIFPSCAQVTTPPKTTLKDHNSIILAALKSMPSGYGYEASPAAVHRLAAHVSYKNQRFHQDLKKIGPSFCSAATYLVFLRSIERLGLSKTLPEKTLTQLAKLDVNDGEEIFGRWNANGPGTAKLFADLNCGTNFTSYAHARPGDFLKMWWTPAIGVKERGHLVIYLSQTPSTITYWSSNQDHGYGTKTTAKSKIKQRLFSRFHSPENLHKLSQLPPKDPFLADMLHKEFSWQQVITSCKVRPTP